MGKGELDIAREYILKTLDVMKNLNFQSGIAIGLHNLGHWYYNIGNLNKALEIIESISVETISNWTKVRSLYVLGNIYGTKGLLDISLDKYKEGYKLAKESSNYLLIGATSFGIGAIYRQKGDLEKIRKN